MNFAVILVAGTEGCVLCETEGSSRRDGRITYDASQSGSRQQRCESQGNDARFLTLCRKVEGILGHGLKRYVFPTRYHAASPSEDRNQTAPNLPCIVACQVANTRWGLISGELVE
jgi:hypothetical protein